VFVGYTTTIHAHDRTLALWAYPRSPKTEIVLKKGIKKWPKHKK